MRMVTNEGIIDFSKLTDEELAEFIEMVEEDEKIRELEREEMYARGNAAVEKALATGRW